MMLWTDKANDFTTCTDQEPEPPKYGFREPDYTTSSGRRSAEMLAYMIVYCSLAVVGGLCGVVWWAIFHR